MVCKLISSPPTLEGRIGDSPPAAKMIRAGLLDQRLRTSRSS
jgi:hypothetical protein